MKTWRDRIPKSLPPVVAPNPADGVGESRKVIRNISELHGDFAKSYKLKGMVMESSHDGMDVVYATRLSDEQEVVVKVRAKGTSFKSVGEEVDWRRTTEVQLNLPKTERICEFIEVIETKESYYVVMEKVNGKDLFEQMAEERLTHHDTREIIRQVLVALSGMHGGGRIHKDLKMENIMVDIDNPRRSQRGSGRRSHMPERAKSPKSRPPSSGDHLSAKLIDFDTADCWRPNKNPRAKDVLGTDGYIAPEAYEGQYSPASDIYCIGVMMYKMLTSRFPLPPAMFDDKPGENYVGSAAMRRIRERLMSETIDFTRSPLDRCLAAADLCSKMLSSDPSERPSAKDALEHRWFTLPPEELHSPRRVSFSSKDRPFEEHSQT